MMSPTTSEVSAVSHSSPGNSPLIAPARFFSETPRTTLLFLPLVLGRLSSSTDLRYSETMPSETRLMFSRAST